MYFWTQWLLLALIVSSFKLVAMKLVSPPQSQLEQHYTDLSDKPFFKSLVSCELSFHIRN